MEGVIQTNRLSRKIVVAALGFPLLIIGILLIPLPGPGIIVCLAALLLLAREFDWAKRHADRLRSKAAAITAKAKRRGKSEN